MQNILTGFVSIIIMSLFFLLGSVIASEISYKIIEPLCEKYPKIDTVLNYITKGLCLILLISIIYCFGAFINNL